MYSLTKIAAGPVAVDFQNDTIPAVHDTGTGANTQ